MNMFSELMQNMMWFYLTLIVSMILIYGFQICLMLAVGFDCKEKGIKTVHFESHYIYNDKIPALRQTFDGFDLKMKLGLETFDYDFRENVLNKGIRERAPDIIAAHFDEANFLFGITGQSAQTMKKDVELGLEYFERICINIMCNNTTDIKPDMNVIKVFMDRLYPVYKDNDRVDILINNTDFGVGD